MKRLLAGLAAFALSVAGAHFLLGQQAPAGQGGNHPGEERGDEEQDDVEHVERCSLCATCGERQIWPACLFRQRRHKSPDQVWRERPGLRLVERGHQRVEFFRIGKAITPAAGTAEHFAQSSDRLRRHRWRL